jgi:hypothetical protein
MLTGMPRIGRFVSSAARLIGACLVLPASATAAPRMLLVDKGGDRILEYDLATEEFVGISTDEDTSHFDTPWGIAKLGPWVYVSATTTQRVIRYDLDDPSHFEILLDFPSVAFPGLSNPRGMADGPDQRVYIAVEGPPASGIGVILVFDPATESMDVYADFPGTMPASSADGLVRPFDVAFGPDGHLYVTNRGALGAGGKPGMNLLRFEGPLSGNPGAPLPTVGNTGALYAILSGQPTSLTFGPDRDGDGESDIYVSHNRTGDRLAVASGPLGATPGASRGPFLVTGVNNPAGLEFRNGELFLAAFPDDQLRVYDGSGSFDRIFAQTGDEPPDGLTGLRLDDPTEFLFLPDPITVPALGRRSLVVLSGILGMIASTLLGRGARRT